MREEEKRRGRRINEKEHKRRRRGRQFQRREEKESKRVEIRMGPFSFGKMTGKGREMADMMQRRKQ